MSHYCGLAVDLQLWAYEHLRFLRDLYVPDLENRGADLMPRLGIPAKNVSRNLGGLGQVMCAGREQV